MTTAGVKGYTIDDARRLTEAAKERGAQPRVHPNGFIQLDLTSPAAEGWHEGKQEGHSGADLRLHVWNPPGIELPHQDTVNEIHDHVFDMRSTVVRGALIQRLFMFVIGRTGEQTHELYRAVYDQKSSSRLEPMDIIGKLSLYDEFVTYVGRTYAQPAFTLHDSATIPEFEGGLVVTMMEKTAVYRGTPRVICPVGQAPDNDFDRATAAPQALLWQAIDLALTKVW